MRKPSHSRPDGTLIRFGDALKALDDVTGRVGGYVIRFGSPDNPDLHREFFAADTYYGTATKSAILYDHGRDPKIGKRRLGEGELKADDVGIWLEGQLNLRDRYEEAIYGAVKAGKMGWSTGSSPHVCDYEDQPGGTVKITAWPLGLDASITPIPVDPRTSVVAMKSLLMADGEDGSVSLSLRLWHNGGALERVTVESSCDRYGEETQSEVFSRVAFSAVTAAGDLTEPERASVATYLDSLRPVVAMLDKLASAPPAEPAAEPEPDLAPAMKSFESLISAVEARGKLFHDLPS